MRNLLIFSIILWCMLLKAEDQYADTSITGKYYGYNLYVVNPFTSDGQFSVSEVIVNGNLTLDQLLSNAFEIDFSLLGLEPGSSVEIVIRYQKAYPPHIVNSEDLLPPDDLRFVNTNSRRGKLNWRISGRPGSSPFVLEQFRWNRWVKVMEVDVSDTIEAGMYSVDITPHSGLNIYRIKKIDTRGQIVYSRDEKYRAGEIPEVNIVSTRTPDEIMFSYETHYEIYSSNGKLLRRGREKYVDVSDIPRGRYFINYDNKTETFTKR